MELIFKALCPEDSGVSWRLRGIFVFFLTFRITLNFKVQKFKI